MKRLSVLKRKFQKYQLEKLERRELMAELEAALIDPGLINRASIESAQQRITNAQTNLAIDGLRHMHNFMRPLPTIDPAFRQVWKDTEPKAKVNIGGTAAQ